MLQQEFVQICRQIWPNLTKEDYCHKTYAGVFRHFEAETRGAANTTGSDTQFGATSLLAIIHDLTSRQDVPTTRSGFIENVRTRLHGPISESTAMRYGERVLRMILGLDIRLDSRGETGLRSGSSTIYWDNGVSLAEVIENHFISDSHHTRGMITGRIDPSFSVAHLCNCRGFKVFWTSNISEHLSISWKSKIITIYEHKPIVSNHLRNSKTTTIPRPILEEVIDTLNLLFPLNDRPTTVFLVQNNKDFQGLGYCSRPRDLCLDLGKFNIWRGRIAELVEIMNEEPKGLKQLALEKDGRNFLPFVTFWVAIAVAFLSLLNIPFTIVSMIFTIKQYDLALAQACAEPNARDALPQYCSSG